MNTRFLTHIKDKNLFDSSHRILLSLSGGVDSVVLFHLLIFHKIEFSAAHINHNTRDGDSDKDAQFVHDLCNKFRIKLYMKSLKDVAIDNNFQSCTRKLRYQFLRSLNYDRILTAHHSDDNLETILFHFITGRSSKSIPEVNGTVVRPLLVFNKSEIVDYAKKNNLQFVEDKTNKENSYDRNFIRNTILPALDSHFTQVKKRIINLASQINKNEDLLTNCASELLELEKADDRIYISKSKLGEGKALLLFHAIKIFGFNRNQAEDINLTVNQIGNQFFSEEYILLIDRDYLIIDRQQEESPIKEFDLYELPYSINFGDCIFSFSLPQGQMEMLDKDVIYCNRKQLGTRLTIRTWQDGDSFQPFGMDGHTQSLKKFFSNNKIDRLLKKQIPILCNSEGLIVWIAGYRQDQRFHTEVSSDDAIKIQIDSLKD